MRKIKVGFTIIILTLVLVEISLRVFGTLASFLNKETINAKFVKNEIRILVLGESTTAPIYSGGSDLAWPGQMKKKLQESLPDFSIDVLNLGVPGINTALLLKNFEQIATAYNPHIVLSMMGINDHVSMTAHADPGFLQSLKIIKLFNEIDRFQRQKKSVDFYSCNLTYNTKFKKEDLHRVLKILDDPENGIKQFLKEYGGQTKKETVEITLGFAWVLFQGSVELDSPPNLNSEKFLILSKLAYSLEPNCLSTTQLLLFTYFPNEKKEDCINLISKKHQSGIYLDELLIRNLNECSLNQQSSEAQQVLKYYGVSSSNRRPIDETFENYRLLAQLTKKMNSLYYIVPYANTDQGLYKNIFTENKLDFINNFHQYISNGKFDPTEISIPDIEFLENTKDIKSALNEHGAKGIFKDMFGKNFGHATLLGDQIIGKNIANQLLISPKFKELMISNNMNK